MTSKVRLLNTVKRPTPIPRSSVEWNSLMRKVIAQAESLNDPRVPSLRLSLSKGESERRLRRLGIISESDINREFKKST